jgi:hypothetical protein
VAANQTPAVCELALRKDLALIFRDGKKAIEHTGATRTTIAPASAGKLDAESMQHVLKRRAPCHLQHRPKRLKLDLNRGRHRRSLLLPGYATKARLSHIDAIHG